MTNWSGIAASLGAIVRPTVLEPRVVVRSIAHLDFDQFKRMGVSGVVIDKDNCITAPNRDDLAPGLEHAWRDLVDAFGPDNVLVVSNSVGTLSKDPALLGAEQVSRNLRVPVLAHKQPKPGWQCAAQIARHFTSASVSSQVVYSPLAQLVDRVARRPPRQRRDTSRPVRLLVIGDRLATDMILAHRLAHLRSSEIETVGVLTTGLHARERLGTRVLRMCENAARRRLVVARAQAQAQVQAGEGGPRWDECVIDSSSSSSLPSPPTSPRQRRRRRTTTTTGGFGAKVISGVSTLSTVAHSVPHWVRRVPRRVVAAVSSAPGRAFTWGLERVPAVAAALHKPLERWTRVYYAPTARRGAKDDEFVVVDRILDRVEDVVARARNRVNDNTK
ncbi:hypothetical protein JCM11491_007248 [Sporobolomyces phaffii]